MLHAHTLRMICAYQKQTMSKSINLYLDKPLVEAARTHVKGNRKHRSLSSLVQMLLVRELRAKGVKIPVELVTK